MSIVSEDYCVFCALFFLGKIMFVLQAVMVVNAAKQRRDLSMRNFKTKGLTKHTLGPWFQLQ